MPRLIDANEAVRQLQNSRVDDPTRGTAGWRIAHTVIIDILANLPTVDAAPVVRCKECREWRLKNHSGATYGSCQLMLLDMPPDGFCNYGRKEN